MRFLITMVSGFAIPPVRRFEITFRSYTKIIERAKLPLGIAVTGFGGFAHPQERFVVVFFHSYALIIEVTEEILRCLIILVGRHLYQPY